MDKNRAGFKSNKYDISGLGTDIINVINYIFMFAFFAIYPLVFRTNGKNLSDNYYFKITKARYEFFIYLSVGFVLIIILAYIFEGIWTFHHKKKSLISIREKSFFSPECMMGFFMAANFLAYLMVVYGDSLISTDSAFYGTDVRYMGFLMLNCRYL